MSELDRLQDAFLKADQLAQGGDDQAKADAAMFAGEIRRLQASGSGNANVGDVSRDFLGQFNRGATQTLDMMNAPRRAIGNAINDLRGAPRAETATDIATSMGAAASEPPTTIAGKAGKGGADALTMFAPALGVLSKLKGAGGVVGMAADDAIAALTTRLGMGAEVVAGSVSGGAQEATKQKGYGETVQNVAGLLAPLSVPAGAAAVRGTYNALDAVSSATPIVGYGKRVAKEVARGFLPMTDAGAREQARGRLQDLAGSPQRAEELAGRIEPKNEFGLTGAEQTGDPNLLGLQSAAKAENPLIRERLDANAEASKGAMTGAVREMGGDVTDARDFFNARLAGFKKDMGERVKRVISGAESKVAGVGPKNSQASNSTQVVQRLKFELDDALMEERQFWGAVPKEATVGTSTAKDAAQRIAKTTPRAQQNDIPSVVKQLLIDKGGLGEAETVAEMHGLYSELRRISRSAMAGTNQNKNLARISNEVADAILEDLGTLDAGSPVGKAVNEARAFSRSLHETFDQGAVGRILKRTLDGDEAIAPETALDKTVGRGGTSALADDQSIRGAAPSTVNEVGDYLRGGFSERIMNASGEFTPKAARTWLRDNAEVLSRYPQMRDELARALKSREAAQAFSIRAAERAKLAESGPIAGFTRGQPEKAVTSILGADNPAEAARSIAAGARKDTSGKALAGVKGAFSDYLTQDADKLPALLSDPKVASALNQVFSPQEMGRLRVISSYMKRAATPEQGVGEVINAPTTKVVDFVVRHLAAKYANTMYSGGGMGTGLQTAQMASSRAREWLAKITNAKARRILMDAVENPELMKALLTETRGGKLPPKAASRLAPYLTGAIAAELDQ